MAFNSDLYELIEKDPSGLLAVAPHWERVALGEVCAILNGAPFDSSLFSTEGPHPLVRIRDVVAGRTTTFYTGPNDPDYEINDGDLLVGMDGDFHCAYWRGGRALLNQRVCRLAPDERWLSKAFLAYGLPGYLKVINDHTPSVTVKHLSSKTVAAIPFAAPPRSEQDRIVDKLDELLSDLDAGVAELQTAQQKLQRYRQSLLKAAVEGALTAEWRKKNPPTETGTELLQCILRERRARWEAQQLAKFAAQGKAPPKGWKDKHPEPQPPKTEGLPALPEGWVWASMDALLERIETGKSFKCDERPPLVEEVGVIKVSAVSWGEFDELESKTCTDKSMIRKELFVARGDFLFSRANTIELVGACVIAGEVSMRVMLSDKILRFVLVDPTLKRWILTALRSDLGRKQIEHFSSGNQDSMRNIGQDGIRHISIPLPPPHEMGLGLEHLSIALSEATSQEAAIDSSLKQASAQRQNLLRAAFRGELVPQDPNDEPASVLLERLRAERKATPKPAKAERKSRKPKGAA